ncbi:MAG TPA: carboxypeptidase-like regulatory domain-containing protein [Candidatus Wallbacteria bacterium]|nr:MAG: hypothetical protein BWY32_01815 [bacterium ADurb.Bin243]HOD40669.1 carboxypeptidase-like regulatory domain-containing protein [Candidatus Wallbacteria bacterium]HPG57788.1 carboxypeptidase-like regulatory domain-containing protein [Candidatus Wallbacteria bacterium]
MPYNRQLKSNFLSAALLPALMTLFLIAASFAPALAAQNVPSSAPESTNGAETVRQRQINFSRVVGMAYDIRTSNGLKNCEIRIGKVKTTTNENGYFEIPSMLYGEYIITALHSPHERYIDVIKIDSPLSAIKIFLAVPAVKISETEKANREYDRALAKIMKGNVNEISINGDESAPKKSSYYSKYGRKSAIEEDTRGRSYSKKSKGEVSKAPRISADRGFGYLVYSVFESSGGEIENDATITIATQSVQTEKSKPVEIHNVPAGSYKITVKCEGYASKTYDRVTVKPGKNERSFFIDKAKK